MENSLQLLNKKLSYKISDEQIYSVANSRLGLYKCTNGNAVNFLLNRKILAIRKGNRLSPRVLSKIVILTNKCSVEYKSRTYNDRRKYLFFLYFI